MSSRPPRLPELILERLTPGGEREFLLGDLHERYGDLLAAKGPAVAHAWYWIQVLKALVSLPGLWRAQGPREQVNDELLFHLESLVERYLAQGMTEEEAWASVQEQVGDLKHVRVEMIAGKRDALRSSRRRQLCDAVRGDLRVALRQFRKRPGFTILAVVTLGLGIGASTTLFSVVKDVLWDPLPYPESSRLFYVGTTRGGGVPSYFTAPEFVALRASTRTLESYTAYRRASMIARVGGWPEQFPVLAVTEDYFSVFGVAPVLGRAFLPEDYQGNASPVIIMSHRVWQAAWGGDLRIVGTVITPIDPPWTGIQRSSVGAISYTVVGVMPPDFSSGADFWIPESLAGTELLNDNFFTNWTHTTVGRLEPGRRLEDLREETASLAAVLAAEHPEYYSGRYYQGRSIDAVSLLDRTVVNYRRSTMLLFGAAGLLLVIAVANLAGLLLARALNRTQEMAVRAALGAGRGRVARQVVTETTTLTLFSSVVGIAIAVAGVRLFWLLAPATFPRLDAVTVNVWAALFAAAVALISGVLCGIAPAILGSSGKWLAPTLHGAARGGGRKGTARLWSGLVGVQVALAVYLLVGAGLLTHNYWRLRSVSPGIDSDHLLILPINTYGHNATAHSYSSFLSEIIQRVGAVPGVESASWIPDPPLYGGWWNPEVLSEGTPEDAEPMNSRAHSVGPDYFRTLGIPLLRGRGIDWQDDGGSEPVAVVDEVAAGRLWPAEDPLGKRLRLDREDTWYSVVGVVGSIHQWSLAENPTSHIYVPGLQRTQPYSQARVVIRSSIPATDLARAVRAAVWEVDRDVPAPTLETMDARIAEDLRDPRFNMALVGFFSLSAVLLSIAGVYTLMLCLIAARTREIGIRAALGASRRRLLLTLSRQCLLLILAGSAVGVGLAAGTSRVIASLLFGVSPLDASTYLVVSGGLGVSALVACLLPAWRAAAIDPTIALRAE